MWSFKKKTSSDEEIFINAAKKVFDAVVASNSYAGQILRAESKANLQQYWEQKAEELAGLIGTDNPPGARTLRMRAHWAQCIEHLALGEFYANLDDPDRDLFAKFSLVSTRAEQDEHYRYALAGLQLDKAIIEHFFRTGWNGNEAWLERAFELAQLLKEQCDAQSTMLMQSARAKSEGGQLTEAQKEQGKTDYVFKEAARRRLAGIPFDDEPSP